MLPLNPPADSTFMYHPASCMMVAEIGWFATPFTALIKCPMAKIMSKLLDEHSQIAKRRRLSVKRRTELILLEPAMVKASVYFFCQLIEVAVNLLST